MAFDRYIGIDYSGASHPDERLRGLAVFQAYPGEPPSKVNPPEHEGWNWTRREIADWLAGQLRLEERIIVGIDHAFSFPISYFERYHLDDWKEFLIDFCAHWPTQKPGQRVNALRQGNQRTGNPDELRLTEKWTSSAKSIFRFGNIPGLVATSTHAGIPWLKFIRDAVPQHVHFWPFDGFEIEEGKSAIVEVYPAIFKNRYAREDRNEHEHDAYSIARWLSDRDSHGLLEQYFTPKLTAEEWGLARLEGWILGVL